MMQINRSTRAENWNALSHGLGFLAALVALPFLIHLSVARGDPFGVVSSVIFGTTMLLTLGASTVYHASRSPRNRRILQIIDHMSIYLLIAGIAFSTGVAFYLQDHRRGFHFAWHLFVMAGCAGLYGAVFMEIARA